MGLIKTFASVCLCLCIESTSCICPVQLCRVPSHSARSASMHCRHSPAQLTAENRSQGERKNNDQTGQSFCVDDLLCSIKKSGSTGENLKEAQAINKSLSALGDVISALATEQPHIPYRSDCCTLFANADTSHRSSP